MHVRLWGSVFAFGSTVRAAGNRFTELRETVHYSLWAVGVFTSATGNQATHCVFTDGTTATINQANQVMNPTLCQRQ
jgi:hypothetical protein